MSIVVLNPADVISITVYTGWLGLTSPPFSGEGFIIERQDGKWQRRRFDSSLTTEIPFEHVSTLLEEVGRPVEMRGGHGSLSMTDDSPSIRIKALFKSGEFVYAVSSSPWAGMVPWHIFQTTTGRLRESGNPVLGMAVAALLPADATNHSPLDTVFEFRSAEEFEGWFRQDPSDSPPFRLKTPFTASY